MPCMVSGTKTTLPHHCLFNKKTKSKTFANLNNLFVIKINMLQP